MTADASYRFLDRTAQAGLDFRQYCGGDRRYFIEQVAAGAALIDVFGDGRLGVYFPQPTAFGGEHMPPDAGQRLYLNDGRGKFTLAPNAFGGKQTDYGIAAAVGDYNNDGLPDLYVCCYGRNVLYRNNGDGTFTDVTERAGMALGGFSTGAVWFDYDGDGLLDLYVLRYCWWWPESDVDCRGPHGEPGACLPTTYPAARNALFHNNGDGTFTDVTERAGVASETRRSLGVVAADFDGDGRIDLFVANDLGPNSLFRNRGDGTFEDVAMQSGVAFGMRGNAQANMGVAVGDFDEDGDLDILVTTFQSEPDTLYRNEGGYFVDATAQAGLSEVTLPYLGFGTGFIDCANQGRLDLFIANGHVSPSAHLLDGTPNSKEANLLIANDGRGHFRVDKGVLPTTDVRVHRGACFGDLDNDGKIDILVTATDDRPTYLHNECVSGNWLMLRLIDRHGCATPVGTSCTAYFGGLKRLRPVIGGGSYAGSSDYRVHFGLGDAKRVDRIEIRWISGQRQTLEGIDVNQILIVREPHAVESGTA